MSILSNRKEEPRPSDYGRYDIPGDKIRVKGEPYEDFYTVWNRKDASKFMMEYNRLAKKHLNVRFMMVVRRHYQKGVFYDIYRHRWAVKDLRDNKIKEVMDKGYKGFDPEKMIDLDVGSKKWQAFKTEVNSRLGKVYA